MTLVALDHIGFAARAGIKASTARKYGSDGRLPPPDVTVGGRPGWLPETVDRWLAQRPGQGAGGGRPSTTPTHDKERDMSPSTGRMPWEPPTHPYVVTAWPHARCDDCSSPYDGDPGGWTLQITRAGPAGHDTPVVDTWTTHRLDSVAELRATWDDVHGWAADDLNATLLRTCGYRLAGPWRQHSTTGRWRADADGPGRYVPG